MSTWIRPAHAEDIDEIAKLNDVAFGQSAEVMWNSPVCLLMGRRWP